MVDRSQALKRGRMTILKNALQVLRTAAPAAWRLLIGLLIFDAVIIGIYIAYGVLDVLVTGEEVPHFWRISEDFSASEILNYLKWFFICTGLGYVFMRTHIALYLSYSIVFLLVLMDDALQLHERGGAWLVQMMDIGSAFGLRGQDFGELAVWGALGVVVVAVLIAGCWNVSQDARKYGAYLHLVLGGLVATAIGFDMLNAVDGVFDNTTVRRIITGILTIAEDGGEMIVGSFACFGVAALLARYVFSGKSDPLKVPDKHRHI